MRAAMRLQSNLHAMHVRAARRLSMVSGGGGRNELLAAAGKWISDYPVRSTILIATTRGFISDTSAQQFDRHSAVTAAAASSSDDAGAGGSCRPSSGLLCDWLPDWLDGRRLFLYVSFTKMVAFVYDRPLYSVVLPWLFPTFVQGARVWSNVLKATAFDCFFITPCW